MQLFGYAFASDSVLFLEVILALVNSGFTLTVVLVDSGNNSATKKYELQSADYAEAVTDSSAILAALTPISTARIRSYSIIQKFEEDAFSFPTNVEIENQAEIVARLATPNETATIYIPAPIASIFVGPSGEAYNTVDGTDTLVENYLAIFNENAQAFISDGEFITPTVAQRFKSGKRIHKASRKG